jgi:hypothetical protein
MSLSSGLEIVFTSALCNHQHADAGFRPYFRLLRRSIAISVDSVKRECHYLFYGEFTRCSNHRIPVFP